MDLGAASSEPFVNGAEELASFPSALSAPSAALLLQALAGAGIGTWQFDTTTGLTSWDAASSRILGYEPISHVSGGMGPVHPDDQMILREALERGLQESKPYDIQFRGIRADGEIRWLHAVAGPPTACETGELRVTGIVADVTSRKAMDFKLRVAEERHDIISRAATDLVFEWDLATDVLRWNDSAVIWLQHRPEDIASSTGMQEWLHPEEQKALSAEFHGALQDGRSEFTMEHRLKRGDGTFADVVNTLHIIRDQAGQAVQIISTMHDVTELKRADAALRASEAVNRSIVEASTDIIQLLDADGKLQFMNGAGVRALEVEDARSLVGKDWVALWPRSARRAARKAVAAARLGGVGRFTELCPTAAGDPRWWNVVVSPVLGSDGQTTKLVTISRDITDKKQAMERVEWNANHDPLTKLANRAAFQARLDEMISAAQEGPQFGLLLFDLDDFKQVNDTLGHDAGDAVLVKFASRLNEVLGNVATLARLGGDEFAAIVPDLPDADGLTRCADSILRRMREPFVNEGRILDCHVTIGGAVFPQHGQDASELFKSADVALYAAKSASRGASMIFEPRHRAQVQERLSMISRARTGVSEDRIVPYYQPKVLLQDGSICGFEALLRWHHPDNGLQLPATIAAAFEDLDLAKAISVKIIDQVIRDLRDWLDRDIPFDHVAVNAGAAEFRHDDFGESILERLALAGIPTRCFQLEVTETVFLGRGAECVERALKLLAAAGVKIALDDFGTGYASLRHLKQFPVDVIKIDQSFVREMNSDFDDAAIIEAVLHLGRSLKIDVVAEGIETNAQAARLRELGCRFGQGFLYAEAVPGASVANC